MNIYIVIGSPFPLPTKLSSHPLNNYRYNGCNFSPMAMAMGFQYLVLVWMVISCAMADKAKDREECTNELVGLATCLPYVGGQAKSPTPDCCSGLKQVLKDDKKCLCVIIRDRDDPELGLNINVTLALGLPSVCHASANVSQCPGLYMLVSFPLMTLICVSFEIKRKLSLPFTNHKLILFHVDISSSTLGS